MLNGGLRGGWGAGATTAPPNPFDSANSAPGNPFAKPPPNPFLQASHVNTQPPARNPFSASPAIPNPFSAPAVPFQRRSKSPSFKPNTNGATGASNPFAVPRDTSAPRLQPSKPPTAQLRRPSPASIATSSRKVAEFVQPAWPNGSNTSSTQISDVTGPKRQKKGLGLQGHKQNGRRLSNPPTMAGKRSPAVGLGLSSQPTFSQGGLNNSFNKHDGRSHDLASKIQLQLSKDRITPPQWPANPGSHAQRQAMEAFREAYKSYREKARKSLIKAGLIDDPDRRRTLQQALDFRGISEEMCPEWEKITRITEYDIRYPEKAVDDSGELVAVPSLMVKRLARSAAGQDAPLPMDVRSFATLRKTLDYLIDDLIPEDSLLPPKHSFLWDRTRAIRIDLSVQKYNLTPDERMDLVYCLETIARFHVTALHLLSQDGFAAEDFSEQQEIEQLGKTLISLKELYDDSVEQGVECANEAEFRGYYIVFNARNPSIKETVEGWGTRLWNSDGIRTAMCLVESMQNAWTLQGPLHPHAPTEVALGAAAIFFSIVSSPQISYTMACFAEIHFNDVRKSMLQIIRKSYTRPRDGPKDITPAFLKERLRFDAEEEAVDFAQKHGIAFGYEGAQRYAILNSRQPIEDPRMRHAFSWGIVERKRSGHSLPDVIHRTIYDENEDEPTIAQQEESLFVPDTENTPSDTRENLVNDDSEPESVSSMVSSSPFKSLGTQSDNKPLFDRPQPQSAAASSSSTPNIGHPAQTVERPVSATPTTAGLLSTQNPNTATTSSFPSLPHASPIENGSSFTKNDGSSQSAIKQSTLFPYSQGSPASDSATSLTSPSPSDQKDNESPKLNGDQLRPTPFSGAFAKPSLFSSNDDNNNLTNVSSSKPTSIVPSDLLDSANSPTHPQGLRASGAQCLFSKTTPSSIPSSDKASGLGSKSSPSSVQPNSNVSLVEHDANIPSQSASTSGLSTASLEPDQSGSNTARKTSSVAIPTTMAPIKDPMGDFTRWFVLADKGLLEAELEAFAVEQFLKGTWEDFRAAEEDRIRREEDEKSWAEALKYRHHSLKVTYFYRWRDIGRKRRAVRRIQLEKEKARKWSSIQSVKEREIAKGIEKEKAIQEAKELVGKRTKEHAQEMTRMQESTQSRQSLEDALLATGVFKGVRNEREAAHHAAQDDDAGSDNGLLPTEQLRLRYENQRRRTRGLPPLKRYPDARTSKEGSKTSRLRAIAGGTGRDSLSMSTGSLRNSTFSSSYRSSLGFNHNRVQKPRSNVSDPYWRMKANGLVLMPNGEYLHESLALPMLQEGKRFPGLGDYGLPPKKSFTPSQSPPAGLNEPLDTVSPIPVTFPGDNRASRSPSIHDGVTQKRKRGQAEDEDLAAYRNEAPATRKRPKSGDDLLTATTPSADQDFLDSLKNFVNQVNSTTKS
ncbi:hypothetical protein F5Y14DRAFT_409662 [Nemania sp. NC0429]|nr:hypothetical protein F5Y14DRAFT_409662 [Nemania sp. NC0429]